MQTHKTKFLTRRPPSPPPPFDDYTVTPPQKTEVSNHQNDGGGRGASGGGAEARDDKTPVLDFSSHSSESSIHAVDNSARAQHEALGEGGGEEHVADAAGGSKSVGNGGEIADEHGKDVAMEARRNDIGVGNGGDSVDEYGKDGAVGPGASGEVQVFGLQSALDLKGLVRVSAKSR